LAFIALAAMLFIPAGTLMYWQAWIILIIFILLAAFVVSYFFIVSPEFLERRMMYREKEARQRTIIAIGNIVFFAAYLIPGLDHRFGWSHVPVWLVFLSDAMVVLGYYLVFLTFKENSFAARTVEVFAGQKVIDTGPYGVVRHPMYTGMILMFLFVPTALGSYWALVTIIPVAAIIYFRTLNEEEVLRRDLAGYAEYCQKVHYRLVPYIW
jgi:protein-S-isoprenylcysteine O-methyltransferase Ste14